MISEFSDFDSYFYEGSSVLKNKLNIHNAFDLESEVNNIVSINMDMLVKEPIPESFDSGYIRHIHNVLFNRVYEWAGEFRKCDMSRNQDYCAAGEIPDAINKFCGKFNSEFIDAGFANKEEIADILAESWAELNSIHPFRDGNGRSQYIFFNAACITKNYELAASKQDLRNLRTARDSASMGQVGLLRKMINRSLVFKPDLKSEDREAGYDNDLQSSPEALYSGCEY